MHGTVNILSSFIDISMFVGEDTESQNFMMTLTNFEISVRRGDLVAQDTSFLPELVSSLVIQEERKEISLLPNEEHDVFEEIYGNSRRYADPKVQILSTPSFLAYAQGKRLIETSIRSDYDAYTTCGSISPPPVPDREHLTGINTVVADILNSSNFLPLPKWYEVPSQSNAMVVAGIKKRFDFPKVHEPVQRCAEAISFLTKHCCRKARNYDFSPLTWEETRLTATLKSTSGFMSISGEKNIQGILTNKTELLDRVTTDYFDTKTVNHCFHFSPKVERLDTPTNSTKIPRLFSYKTAEVRIVELAYFKKLNDFMSNSSYFPFSYTGNVFERATKVCQAFEKYVRPLSLQIEASKWDGHKDIEWFAASRKFFSDILLSGNSGQRASEMSLRTIWNDGVGTVVSCSGHVVCMKRGNQKSGGWDTSCNNKTTNSFIALQCVITALQISPLEAFNRVTILIEGDDGLIVGEEDDIKKIFLIKDSFYEKCGFPQEVEVGLVSSPEETMFCSMGSTRLTNGTCVPIRNLDEIFGKALVSLANKQVDPTYENYARSLSVICSMAAMYWHDPVVRKVYRICRSLIPKDVNARSVHPSERYLFVNMLGDMDPKTFEMEKWVFETLGVSITDQDTRNSLAIDRMRTKKFERILTLEHGDIVKNSAQLNSRSLEPVEVLWFEDSFTNEYIASKVISKEVPGIISVQTHRRALELQLSNVNLLDWAVTSGSYKAIMRKFRTPLLTFFVSIQLLPRLNILMSKRTTLKREKCVAEACNLMCNDSLEKRIVLDNNKFQRLIKTESSFLYLVLSLILLAGLSFIVSQLLQSLSGLLNREPDLRYTSSRAVVDKGFTVISNQDGVITSTRHFDELFDSKELAASNINRDIYPLFLAICNVVPRFKTFGFSDRNNLSRDFNSIFNWERRFGIFSSQSQAGVCNEIRTAYNSQYQSKFFVRNDYHDFVRKVHKASDENFSLRKVNNKGRQKLTRLNPNKWTINGSMITTHKWYGESSYGQIDRVEDFFKKIFLSNKGQVILRISDLYILEKDGIFGNRYYFPDGIHTGTNGGYLILGESQGVNSRDIARPYGCDWSNRFLKCPKKHTENILIFRGGPTGPGFESDSNVRIKLVQSAPHSIDNTVVDVGFNRGHTRLRIDDTGNIGSSQISKQFFKESIPLEVMMAQRYVLVMEGNEAPDRILTLLGGKCVVIVVDNTHIKSNQSWYWPMILLDDYICSRVKPDWASIEEKIRQLNSDINLRKGIVSRSTEFSDILRKEDTMISYVENTITLSHAISRNRCVGEGKIDLRKYENSIEYYSGDTLIGKVTDIPTRVRQWSFKVYKLTSEGERIFKTSLNEDFLINLRKQIKLKFSRFSDVEIYIGHNISVTVVVWFGNLSDVIMTVFFGLKSEEDKFTVLLNSTEMSFEFHGGLKSVTELEPGQFQYWTDATVYTDCHAVPITHEKGKYTWLPCDQFLYRVKLTSASSFKLLLVSRDIRKLETEKRKNDGAFQFTLRCFLRPGMVERSDEKLFLKNKNFIHVVNALEMNQVSPVECCVKIT